MASDQAAMNRETLLAEYRAGSETADKHWNEYLETGSPKSFANYLAVSRSLSAVYTDLVREGMTLDEIQGTATDGGAYDANNY